MYFLRVLLGLTPLVLTCVAFGESDDRTDLLNGLRDLRAITMRNLPSGHGAAEYQFKGVTHGPDERESSILPHRVDFCFDGEDALWQEYLPEDGKKTDYFGRMTGKGRLITYSVNNTDSLRLVLISNQFDKLSMIDVKPRSWSYKYFAAIPGPVSDEHAFFTNTLSRGASVSKQGKTIVVEYVAPRQEKVGIYSQKFTWTFDMSLGGLLTKYEYSFDSLSQDTRIGEHGLSKLEWMRNGTTFVPLSREAEAHSEENGKPAADNFSRITFKEFKVEPVPADEMDPKKWKIPLNTRVIDQVAHDQYPYSDSVVDKMLGIAAAQSIPAPIATLPALKGTAK